MSNRYRVIVFLIVILVIILIGCSCITSFTSIKEGNSCGGHDESVDRCNAILASGEEGNSEWVELNCDTLLSENFSLLNPLKVVNEETQANETPTGLNLSEYNTFIIGENSRTASNTSCLNNDIGLKL